MITKRDLVVVLGSGYVGRFMLCLNHHYSAIIHTSRNPHDHLSWLPTKQRLRFDLAEPASWHNIPYRADLLWCFPAAPLDAVRNFAQRAAGGGKLVVLGSTSAYDVGSAREYPPPWMDETAPVDLDKPRVQGEELLRREYGAVLLRVAGIYGPGRHPYRWIRSGRVGLSEKYVNLIHVEDLAEVCRAALQCGVPGEAYNVSDGIPRTWREIGARVDGHHSAGAPAGERQPQSGKRIKTAKLRSLLHQAKVVIRHPDLFRALERLDEDDPATSP